jgi:hypothetical protein
MVSTIKVKHIGSAWNLTLKSIVPIPLQFFTSRVHGNFSERDYKLWVFLIHAVFKDLDYDRLYSIPINDIHDIFSRYGCAKNKSWIRITAININNTRVSFPYKFGDDRIEDKLYNILNLQSLNDGYLKFKIPIEIIRMIKSPERFVNVRTDLFLSLKGKITIRLYSILEGNHKSKYNKLNVTSQTLLEWLSLYEYVDFKRLKFTILKKCLPQLPKYKIGFDYNIKFIKHGRSFKEVCFDFSKTNQEEFESKSITTIMNSLRPKITSYGIMTAQKETLHLLDMDKVLNDFLTYWEKTGKPDFKNSANSVFIGFAKKVFLDTKDSIIKEITLNT